MPTYFARANGNVNATNVWATTPTGTAGDFFPSFTNADTLMANGFSVTLNVNVTALEVRNDTANGAQTGGSFALANNVTLTANVVGAATCVTFSGSLSATVVGNVTGNSTTAINFQAGVANNGTGTLNVVGTVSGGAWQLNNGVANNSTGRVNITGDVLGGASNSGYGVYQPTAGIVAITGNVTGGSIGGIGAGNTGPGTITITGAVSGLGTGHGAVNSSGGTIAITGSVTAGSGGFGAANISTGTLTVSGTCTGAGVAGLSNSSTGTASAGRAKGGPNVSSAVGVAAGANGVTSVSEIEYGDAGASPTSGPIRLNDQTSNVAVMFRFGTTKKTLVDTASTALLPAASNVRSGTVYNAGQTTGTCAVPGAASVLVGVSVDNTVGTASVSSAAIQSACDAALAAFSSGRLANVATVASTGQQIADAVTA
jgi:hypothetical protein